MSKTRNVNIADIYLSTSGTRELIFAKKTHLSVSGSGGICEKTRNWSNNEYYDRAKQWFFFPSHFTRVYLLVIKLNVKIIYESITY